METLHLLSVYYLFIAVNEIQCTFGNGNLGTRESIIAKLRKPEGFKGHPLFADDRAADPESDPSCQIKEEPGDPTGLKYNLKIYDFNRCGVLKRNVSIYLLRGKYF